jgi:hypothetical protein
MAKWINPTRLIAEPSQYSEAQFRAALADYRIGLCMASSAQIRTRLAKIVRDLEAALAQKSP